MANPIPRARITASIIGATSCRLRTVNESRSAIKVEPKKFSLPACTACPEVVITDEGVITIGEDANTVRLSRDASNELIRLIKQGELHEI